VECASLDGEDKQTVSKFGMWEDSKIVNMALDNEAHQLYITIYNPLIAVQYSVFKRGLMGLGH
jgi:hypothetical protein